MGVKLGTEKPGGFRVGAENVGGLKIGTEVAWRRPVSGDVYTFTRTLDRTWGSGAAATPGSGGGNVTAQTFEHEDEDWELWQVVPYLGTGVNPPGVGDCRIQLRNRDINRGSMQLADMPDRVVITRDGWANSPWTFNRPTANNKFTNVASGNSARKGIDYEPVRTVGANPAAEGIAQGQTFTVALHWD